MLLPLRLARSTGADPTDSPSASALRERGCARGHCPPAKELGGLGSTLSCYRPEPLPPAHDPGECREFTNVLGAVRLGEWGLLTAISPEPWLPGKQRMGETALDEIISISIPCPTSKSQEIRGFYMRDASSFPSVPHTNIKVTKGTNLVDCPGPFLWAPLGCHLAVCGDQSPAGK